MVIRTVVAVLGLFVAQSAHVLRADDATDPPGADQVPLEGRILPSVEDAESAPLIHPVAFQPMPPVLPQQPLAQRTPVPRYQPEISTVWLGGIGQSLLTAQGSAAAGHDLVLGIQSKARATTDAGSLLQKSPEALGLGIQRRTPIVNDPRVRGGRVGQLAASGSYWVPARIDLDTALNKIDSRLIDSMEVIKGPYSVMNGPGFHFVEVELLPSPRYANGPETHGGTSVDYQLNGEQWYGRQTVLAGDENWGARLSYGHRTGNDYTTGDDVAVPSSYKSRDWNLAVGYDLGPDDHLEFNYLRLDQTDVEFPGQAFDIDVLVTNGYELKYVSHSFQYADRADFDVWHNHTWFNGSAQRPGKRREFPIYDFFHYTGFTDVDSVSTGFRQSVTWGDEEADNLKAGADLRYVKQDLNEIASGRIGFNVFQDANSPIPRSQSTNPGLFVQESVVWKDRVRVTAGVRADVYTSAVIEDPANLAHLGLQQPQSSLADILGTDRWNPTVATWSLFLTSDYALSDALKLLAGVGHGERPASLTEMYAAQPFMFLLQNGLNTVTGDPRLRPEKVTQVDLGVRGDFDFFRTGVGGYYAWAQDYITFENIGVFRGPPYGNVQQVNLKYVNTDLATFVGAEAYAEYDVNPWLSPFATLSFVEGTDQTRNGDFATLPAAPGQPSTRVYGDSRGFFSGITGGSSEPLPGIVPLESRLGVRFHEPQRKPKWMIEFSARIVDSQNRVASSLLESPTAGFTTFDLRSYWKASDHLLLLAGVENLTNRNYREHLDFRNQDGLAVYEPGLNSYFGVELTY